jgi:hypothetical protein
MTDDQPRLRLVSDRVAAWEWESFPRGTMRPRYRQRGLAPWRPKLSEAKAVDEPPAKSPLTFLGSVG